MKTIGFRGLLVAGVVYLTAASSIAIAEGAPKKRVSAPGKASWVCNAYGRETNRNTWQMVSGARMPTEAAAKASALRECAKRRTACGSSGCWPD